jgi:hypothetical protein
MSDQTEEKYSVILEEGPMSESGYVNRHQRWITRKLGFIEANNLDDAWEKARVKWLMNGSTLEIVDIMPGELTEPLRPSERVEPRQTETVEDPAVQEETHDG